MKLPAYIVENRVEAEALLRHYHDFRPQEWGPDTTLETLAREMEADAELLQEEDPEGDWSPENSFWNALDNHTFGRDWCEACDA